MFTGIVTAVGSIAAVAPTSGGVRMRVSAPDLGLADGQVGESIAVNGVCLTAVVISSAGFTGLVRSQIVSNAMDSPVRASISTPVFSAISATQNTSTEKSSGRGTEWIITRFRAMG